MLPGLFSRFPRLRARRPGTDASPARASAAILRIPSLALAAALTAPLASAGDTAAALPGRLEVARSIEIAAPADKVWAIVGNFGDLGYLDAMISKTEIIKGKNNTIGAQRSITLKDGGRILETLTARRSKPYVLSYRMDQGPLPVAHYRSKIEVLSSGNASRVVWSGSFRRQTAENMPAGHDDANAAVNLIGEIYEKGLAALKLVAER